jgi:putative ABC transport system permease protein
VEPGDVVTTLGLTPDGMLNALDIEVAGIVTTGIQELDLRYLKVHLVTAQRLLQTELVSDLLVALDDTANTERVATLLGERFASHDPALSVVDWRQRAPFFDQVRNLYLGIFWFMGSVIFVLVVLSASNTLLMTFMERIREIGTMRAIGTSRGQVAQIVLYEALWLGLIGALLGDFLGIILIKIINAFELKMPPPPGAVSPIDLQLAVVPEAFVGAVVLMVFVLAAAAWVPIIKTARLKVVEALSHV